MTLIEVFQLSAFDPDHRWISIVGRSFTYFLTRVESHEGT